MLSSQTYVIIYILHTSYEHHVIKKYGVVMDDTYLIITPFVIK